MASNESPQLEQSLSAADVGIENITFVLAFCPHRKPNPFEKLKDRCFCRHQKLSYNYGFLSFKNLDASHHYLNIYTPIVYRSCQLFKYFISTNQKKQLIVCFMVDIKGNVHFSVWTNYNEVVECTLLTENSDVKLFIEASFMKDNIYWPLHFKKFIPASMFQISDLQKIKIINCRLIVVYAN